MIDPKPNTGREISVGSVRVATFNVLSPLLADWHHRKKVVAEQLRAAEPDIVALQEVDAGAGRKQSITRWRPHSASTQSYAPRTVTTNESPVRGAFHTGNPCTQGNPVRHTVISTVTYTVRSFPAACEGHRAGGRYERGRRAEQCPQP
ncbi:endonuclease/exonuclease/phosphatase family protein [Nocardia sp. NPDC019395]|uniref:endonuclease/exonuclease/phosphatase family protein n=1 Tax=Nocardia sp. NPDC019395 TaxID=3154686 RepID=UPI0033C39F7B